MKYFGIISTIILFLFDQLIKFLIRQNLRIYESITIIPKFFHLTYVENDGGAWNILSGNKIILILSAFVVLIVLYETILKKQTLTKIEIISYSLFVGGVLGNLCDRIFLGVVVDYLDFNIFGYSFPVFNLADIGIVLGTLLLMIDTLWGEKLWKKLKLAK